MLIVVRQTGHMFTVLTMFCSNIRVTLVLILAVLTIAVENSRNSSKCTKSKQKPQFSITSSEHLSVSWANAFEKNCFQKLNNVTRTEVVIQGNVKNRSVEVKWPVTNKILKTDLCLFHVVEIKLTYTHKGIQYEEFSRPAYFNAYHLPAHQTENLYTGLLKEKVLDKVCKKASGEYVIPPIPREIQNCPHCYL